MDIDTEGTTNYGTDNDTEIGLYAANGAFIATDDDGGTGFLSLLSFGTAAIGHGADGDLPAGTYYLAVSGYNAAFSDNWSVATGSTRTGNVITNFRTDIGGGGGGSVVNPSLIIVVEGGDESGVLADLFTSDDVRYSYFNNPETLSGEIEFQGQLTSGFTTLTFVCEAQVGRPGIIQQIRLFNFVTNQFVTLDGTIGSSGVDSTREVVVTSQVYTNDSGSLRTRVKHYPALDEAPALDGWTFSFDVAHWEVN